MTLALQYGETFGYDKLSSGGMADIQTNLALLPESDVQAISEYLQQLSDMGEDVSEYEDLYGYSLGQTEPRTPLYEYPAYDFEITDELSNLRLEEVAALADPELQPLVTETRESIQRLTQEQR